MITHPLDLASKLRPPPRNFDALFLVNGALIVLFFFLFGSRFVLAPGLGMDFRLPEMAGAIEGAAPATVVISVPRSDMVLVEDGMFNYTQLRGWLQKRGQQGKGPGAARAGRPAGAIGGHGRHRRHGGAGRLCAGCSGPWSPYAARQGETLRTRRVTDMPMPNKRRRAGWWVAGLTVVFALMALTVLFRPLGKNANTTPSVAAPKGQRRAPRGGSGRPAATGAGHDVRSNPAFPADGMEYQPATPADNGAAPARAGLRPFPPKPVYGEAELALPMARPDHHRRSPVELLKEPTHDPFLGFDREDVPLTPLSPRQACVEVRKAGTGEMSQGISANWMGGNRVAGRPAGLATGRISGHGDRCRPAGAALGRPVDTANSDIEEVDAFFRDYLANTLHLGERLPPGMYRVVVGP